MIQMDCHGNSTKQTLYRKIYESIKSNILNHDLKPGDKLPTDQELTEQFRVSRITATRAMKELEQDGYVKRIRKAGTFVNDIVEISQKKTSDNSVIAIILPFGESIGFDIIHGAQEEALKHGVMVTFYNTCQDGTLEYSIVQKMLEMKVVGLAVYPCTRNDNIELFSQLLIDKVPLVFLDRPIFGLPVPVVSSDNRMGMYNMVSHVLEKGHRRVAFVCNSITQQWTESERFIGFTSAMIEHGMPVNKSYIIQTKEYTGDKMMAIGEYIETIANKFLAMDAMPTAIVCSNDIYAVNLSECFQKKGYRVPQDFSITGFDNTYLSPSSSVPITTVEQPFRQIGASAINVLMQMINNSDYKGEEQRLSTKLIERESVYQLI